MLRPGDLVGGWTVDGPLAEGGMGTVYRVHSAMTERLVAALKIMKPSADPQVRARFVREAESLAALRHPSVVRVMEFAEDPSRELLYLVMELADGETLRERLARGPLGLDEALALFVPLARGLDDAHDRGVFHRDLKPSNIVLCHDGTVRLVDFGIAAAQDAEPLTNTGQLGTLAYLPPEVFKGEKTAPASADVYAFGLLMHEALTGVRAFPVDPHLTPAAAAAAVGVRKLQPPELELPAHFPEGLRDLIRRATASDPNIRPRMRAIRTALEALAPQDARPLSAEASPPAVESTMRVPDPTPGPLLVRLRRASGPQMLAAGGLAAFVMASGAAWMARNPRPTSTASAAKVGRVDSRLRSAESRPSARPTAPPRARPTPPPRAARPSPAPNSEARGPLFGLLPAPLRLPSATATPPERVAVKHSASAPVLPAEAEPPSPTADVSGRWELKHEFAAGLRAGYVIELEQQGDRVSGSGLKVSENGEALPPDQRAAVEVSGHVKGETLEMTFVERTSAGPRTSTVRWRISPDALEGHLETDGDGGGSSAAHRLREEGTKP